MRAVSDGEDGGVSDFFGINAGVAKFICDKAVGWGLWLADVVLTGVINNNITHHIMFVSVVVEKALLRPLLELMRCKNTAEVLKRNVQLSDLRKVQPWENALSTPKGKAQLSDTCLARLLRVSVGRYRSRKKLLYKT